MRVLPQYLIPSLGGRSSYPTGGPVYGGPDTGKPFMGGGGRSSYPTGGPVYGGPDTGKPFAESVEDSDIGKQRLARSRARKFLQSYSGNMTPNIGDSTTYIK